MSDIHSKVVDIISDSFSVDICELSIEKSFTRDLGTGDPDFDNCSIAIMINALEDAFDIEIPDDQVEKIDTVHDAISYIMHAPNSRDPNRRQALQRRADILRKIVDRAPKGNHREGEALLARIDDAYDRIYKLSKIAKNRKISRVEQIVSEAEASIIKQAILTAKQSQGAAMDRLSSMRKVQEQFVTEEAVRVMEEDCAWGKPKDAESVNMEVEAKSARAEVLGLVSTALIQRKIPRFFRKVPAGLDDAICYAEQEREIQNSRAAHLRKQAQLLETLEFLSIRNDLHIDLPSVKEILNSKHNIDSLADMLHDEVARIRGESRKAVPEDTQPPPPLPAVMSLCDGRSLQGNSVQAPNRCLCPEFPPQSAFVTRMRALFPGTGDAIEGRMLYTLAEIGLCLCAEFDAWKNIDSSIWTEGSRSELSGLMRSYQRMISKVPAGVGHLVDENEVRDLASLYVSGIRSDAKVCEGFEDGKYTLLYFTINFANAIGCGGALQTALEWHR